METFVVGGLAFNTIENITKLIKESDFNCLRLPFSITLVDKNPIPPQIAISANPDLFGLTCKDIVTLFVSPYSTFHTDPPSPSLSLSPHSDGDIR
jgi:hypothetical protein